MKRLLILSITFLFFTACTPNTLEFSTSEKEEFIKNGLTISDYLLKNGLKKDSIALFDTKMELDSVIGDNDINFDKIKSIEIGNDYIIFTLRKYDNDNELLTSSKFYHKIIYTRAKKANNNLNSEGNIVYLVENDRINPKWADIWGVLEIVYWEKLADNLFYYIIEETF